MAFGIYKPGQGYWMRVVTASMLGILTLATATWIASEARRVAGNLPKTSYIARVDTSSLSGAPVAGTTVELLGKADKDHNRPVLGTAKILSFDTQDKTVVLSEPVMNSADADASRAESMRPAEGTGTTAFSAVFTDRPRGVSSVEPLYIEGGAAIIVIIFGALLILWLTGMQPKSVEFLVATDMEMKKVNWSTRRDITASTWVVIGASFLISALLLVFDLILKTFFQLIGVLVK
jgi:preprotein translocase SecE subunit